MEEEARCFLGRFVEEFPAALEKGSPPPVSPLSRKVSLEELHGESLELGLRLLTARYDKEREVHKLHFTHLVGLKVDSSTGLGTRTVRLISQVDLSWRTPISLFLIGFLQVLMRKECRTAKR